jgi:8-oxo-dGTP pyrophosphatase MutT (NUDIX family)
VNGRVPRPRRSASLILIDRQGAAPRILLGKRDAAQKFMPEKFVFPGGKTDRSDHRLRAAGDLHPDDSARLAQSLGSRSSASKVRAIAMSAIRETYEETGLKLQTDLSRLRLIARAVTPPIYPHRYDTHFFAAFADETIADLPMAFTASGELLELGWFSFQEASGLDLPEITRIILGDVAARLAADPALADAAPIPFYAMLRGTMRRTIS